MLVFIVSGMIYILLDILCSEFSGFVPPARTWANGWRIN